MQMRYEVEMTLLAVASEHGKPLPPLADDLPLLDSGLDSLCLAVIVARLEDRLGIDPFAADEPVDLPVTLGDFIQLYEAAGRKSLFLAQ